MKFSSVLLAAGTARGGNSGLYGRGRLKVFFSDLYKIYEPLSFHKALDKCQDQGGNIPLGRFQMLAL